MVVNHKDTFFECQKMTIAEIFVKKAKKSLIYFPIAVFVGANTSNEVLLFQQLQISSDYFFRNAKFFSELLCRRMSVFGESGNNLFLSFFYRDIYQDIYRDIFVVFFCHIGLHFFNRSIFLGKNSIKYGEFL